MYALTLPAYHWVVGRAPISNGPAGQGPTRPSTAKDFLVRVKTVLSEEEKVIQEWYESGNSYYKIYFHQLLALFWKVTPRGAVTT